MGFSTPSMLGSELKSPIQSPSWGVASAQFSSTWFKVVLFAIELTVRCTLKPALGSEIIQEKPWKLFIIEEENYDKLVPLGSMKSLQLYQKLPTFSLILCFSLKIF
jgi:hypothetical protein